MAQKNEIENYRLAVLKVMMEAKDENGEFKLTESQANKILDSLTDADIEFGMPFNTPQETAEMIMED
jgi:hypothetical protein